jgi:hypothetical protein
MVQLDLRAEPMVLCMPEIEKARYYDVQLIDMYTDNYGYIGSRATGNGAGCYLVAGPEWKGATPPGIAKAFRSETQFSLVIYRTQLFNPTDMDNVKKVQAGYKVQPLSAFLGQPAPPAAPAIDWPKFEQEAFTTRFAEYLDFLLQFCPPVGPAAVEKPLREKFARITNGIGSETVASSIVAVNQKDPTKLKVIFPFGQLKSGEWSFAPPKPQTDPENSMIYSADMGVGKVAGIKLDQATGEMKTVWVADDTTNAFQPLIGPKDKRVMLLSNAKKNVEKEPIKLALFTANYKEQVTWRDASSGRIIAQSDFFESLSPGSLITPGFGGRVYFPTGKGFIVLQVMPKPSSSSSK